VLRGVVHRRRRHAEAVRRMRRLLVVGLFVIGLRMTRGFELLLDDLDRVRHDLFRALDDGLRRQLVDELDLAEVARAVDAALCGEQAQRLELHLRQLFTIHRRSS
jgi:hypothetical protein